MSSRHPGENAEQQLTSGLLLKSSFPAFSLLYIALFAAFGTESPFLPSFLAERGLTPADLGIALAAGTVVRLSSGPIWGLAADVFGTKRVLALAASLAGAVILLYLVGWQFWPVLTVCMLHSLFVTPLNPLADALALPASRNEGVFRYGWVRGVGSASFVGGTLASGLLVARFGTGSIIISASILFFLMVPAIPFLPQTSKASTDAAMGALPALLSIRGFRRMLLIAALVIGSHAMSDTFAVIHWRYSGIGAVAISVLLAEAVTAEIVVFLVLGPIVLRRLGFARCMTIAAGAGVLRWAIFAMTTNVGILAVTEPLHGLTFALLHLACMRVIVLTVPEQFSATAQTIYGSLILGIASATLTLASGLLYGHYGAPAFWLMSLLCFGALLLTRRLPSSNDCPPLVEL